MSVCNLSYSRFGFEARIWVLIAQVPDHCLFVGFSSLKNPFRSQLYSIYLKIYADRNCKPSLLIVVMHVTDKY